MKLYTAHVSLRNGVTVPVQVEAIDAAQARLLAIQRTRFAVSALCRDPERAADWLSERMLRPVLPTVGGAR